MIRGGLQEGFTALAGGRGAFLAGTPGEIVRMFHELLRTLHIRSVDTREMLTNLFLVNEGPNRRCWKPVTCIRQSNADSE